MYTVVEALERRDARAAVRLMEAHHLRRVEQHLQLVPRGPDLATVLEPIT